MQNNIVIARYQEDISWIKSINNIYTPIIYNKYHSDEYEYLPNVGREAHTYLYYIVNNYEKLSDITVFCQGNPFDHDPNFISKILNSSIVDSVKIIGFLGLGPNVKEGIYANFDLRHKNGLPMFYVLNLLFGININSNDSYDTVYGAQFIVSKNNILHRPLSFYRFLLQFVSDESNPIEAYILERLWPYIFNINLQLSPKMSRLLNFF